MTEIQRLIREIENIQGEIEGLRDKLSGLKAFHPQELKKSMAELSTVAWKVKIIEGALQKVNRLAQALQLRMESSALWEHKFRELRSFINRAVQADTPETLVDTALKALKEMTNADRILIVLLGSESNRTRTEAKWVRSPLGMKEILWEDIAPLLRKMGDLYHPLFAPDTSGNPELAEIRSAGVQSFIMMPIQWQERLWGIIYIDALIPNQPFTPDDLDILEVLAVYLAASLEVLHLSHELKQSLYELERVRVIREQEELEKDYLRALFSRFVSPVVVERLASDPSVLRLGGQRQEITVLFADIRGFTSLSERLPPEKLVETLNKYLSLAAEAILEEEGTLDKFIGDAVMAFFNAPYPQENHVLKAAKASLKIKRKLEELHTREPLGLKLFFGIGINVGEAVVGNIGTSMQMNYTAIGDCVNVAKRLQEIAEPGQILISAGVYEQIKDKAVARALPPLTIPGRTTREAVYELIDLLE